MKDEPTLGGGGDPLHGLAGWQWRAIPKDFPPYSTVQSYFYAWSHKGLLAHINQPTSKTVIAHPTCWCRSAPSIRGCAMCSPMAAMGDKLHDAMAALGQWTFEIIKRSDTAKGFELLPRRGVVERTFAWIGRCRRLAKDFEATIESAVAWILIAHIRRAHQPF